MFFNIDDFRVGFLRVMGSELKSDIRLFFLFLSILFLSMKIVRGERVGEVES